MSKDDDGQGDLFEGRKRRDAALDQVEFTKEWRSTWVQRGLQIAMGICERNGWVTSDELQKVYPVPEGIDPRILGAVFNAKRRGFPFKKVGYTQTTQKQAHARPIPIWSFKDGMG